MSCHQINTDLAIHQASFGDFFRIFYLLYIDFGQPPQILCHLVVYGRTAFLERDLHHVIPNPVHIDVLCLFGKGSQLLLHRLRSVDMSRRSVSSEMSTVRISVRAISESISFVRFMAASPLFALSWSSGQQMRRPGSGLWPSAVLYPSYLPPGLSYDNLDCPFFPQSSPHMAATSISSSIYSPSIK